MKNRLLLEHLSWLEIRDRLQEGFFRVIVPVASVEQHGYHLPENTDAVLGEACALLTAEKLGNTLVAPVIRPGISPHHMAMPGTLTLRPETLEMILEDYVHCYFQHGFQEIIFLSSHGGNVKFCEKVSAKIRQQTGKAVYAVSDVPTPPELRTLEEMQNLPAGTNGGHADERETAQMLTLVPELVDMTKAEAGYCGELSPETLERFFTEGVTCLTDVGCVGDPRPAQLDRGFWYREHSATQIAEQILAFSRNDD